MKKTQQFLAKLKLPVQDNHALEPSKKRFPDGGQYRFEIPSVEGPRVFRAVIEAAKEHKVPVHRVSQGSGVLLLGRRDVEEMARIGAGELPIDRYLEVPDNFGGFVRCYEMPQIILVASPVYFKFGLRNAPDIYPSGRHIEDRAVNMARERLHRARIAIDLLDEYAPQAKMSRLGSKDLGIPEL